MSSAGFDYRIAWNERDPLIERDVETFWQSEQLLPSEASADQRIRELCVVAYKGKEVSAVSTAVVRYVSFLGVKLAMFRCSVAPHARRTRLSYEMMHHSRCALEKWSAGHSEEEVMGMGTVTQVETAFLGVRKAILPDSRLAFVGWTEKGERIRVAWFDHGFIPPYRDGPTRQF